MQQIVIFLCFPFFQFPVSFVIIFTLLLSFFNSFFKKFLSTWKSTPTTTTSKERLQISSWRLSKLRYNCGRRNFFSLLIFFLSILASRARHTNLQGSKCSRKNSGNQEFHSTIVCSNIKHDKNPLKQTKKKTFLKLFFETFFLKKREKRKRDAETMKNKKKITFIKRRIFLKI